MAEHSDRLLGSRPHEWTLSAAVSPSCDRCNSGVVVVDFFPSAPVSLCVSSSAATLALVALAAAHSTASLASSSPVLVSLSWSRCCLCLQSTVDHNYAEERIGVIRTSLAQ